MSEICEVVVGLDVHLKKTQVTVMKMNGEVVKKERKVLLALDRFLRRTRTQRTACKPVTTQEHGRYQK